MTNQLAKQLRKVTMGDDVSAGQDGLAKYLFDGLNKKLKPIGLHILHARLGVRSGVEQKDIFASLKAAKIV